MDTIRRERRNEYNRQWRLRNKDKTNAWRKEYRLKKAELCCCKRCYRPIVDGSDNKYCLNCIESGARRRSDSANFF